MAAQPGPGESPQLAPEATAAAIDRRAPGEGTATATLARGWVKRPGRVEAGEEVEVSLL